MTNLLKLNDPGAFWILLFALSLAFVCVYTFTWMPKFKPFNCLKCMTGWITLIISLLYGHPNAILLMAVGIFIGAIFDSIQSRWL